jgi:purine nucleosidase
MPMRPLLLAAAFFAAGPLAAAPKPVPVIIDTDIGSDVDDAFALALAVASPELEIRAITTSGGSPDDRAWLVCRFLTQVGIKKMPVAIGKAPPVDTGLDWQIQYRRHPAAIFNRTLKPVKESAVELLYAKLKEAPGEITIICLGPLTNVAQLLKDHPDAKPLIKRLVVMGGAIKVGYKGQEPPEPEWNIKCDPGAAKSVLAAGVPITLVPLDATATVEFKADERERLFAVHTMLTFQVQNLYELWDKPTPVLFDPVAVAVTFDESHCKFADLAVTVDDKGMTLAGEGKANCRVAMATDAGKFVPWLRERLTSYGKEALPKPPKNVSHLIEQGNFPSRVHTFEDYDTDIEKRWWMCGKAEMKDLPPNGSRCCRATLTQDFDDRQGDLATMYRAVIFNPVPGPPMGKHTRLNFRYKLHGTDTLRVQLYSLTNGYHRYLSVSGLPQDEWRHGTVDMTQMRRPDGSGGPLAENERIDDIQFYIDPRAELLIDDVILYDAAAPVETRPFPRRVLYTGWFDTGKQGKEWPGEFTIVDYEKPQAWKYAKSIQGKDGPLLRLNIRGKRRTEKRMGLSFRYKLAGATALEIGLNDTTKGTGFTKKVADLKEGAWAETVLDLDLGEAWKKCDAIDEILFRLPKGAELSLDDVLLYVPGDAKK